MSELLKLIERMSETKRLELLAYARELVAEEEFWNPHGSGNIQDQCNNIIKTLVKVHNKGKPCSRNQCLGVYTETCITDDWDGTLHCNVCGKQVNTYE